MVKSLGWLAPFPPDYHFLRYDLETAYVNADGLFKMYGLRSDLKSANPPYNFLLRCLLSSGVQMLWEYERKCQAAVHYHPVFHIFSQSSSFQVTNKVVWWHPPNLWCLWCFGSRLLIWCANLLSQESSEIKGKDTFSFLLLVIFVTVSDLQKAW